MFNINLNIVKIYNVTVTVGIAGIKIGNDKMVQ